MKLCFPEKILLQHLVMLGKTGAGKSSALRHIVEHLLHLNRRVCIVDPKGDWWGLKKDADGKGAGFAVIMIGDFKDSRASDVPINAHSGKHVAELIATGNRPCVIGFRGWMHADMVRFWIDFASTLFNRNSGELYLFIDEVHNFAPKGRVMDPEAGKSLHYTNRLMSEGRGLGIVCAIASQRPQKVHNDTLTCCETLVAMRVTHAADRQALEDWIDGCGDGKKAADLLANVAALPRGVGFVWSPEIGFGPERVAFPMFETFDSFAPPQLQRKVSDSGWADVDLGAVKEKLATVIQEAKANDPRELKMTISKLQSEIAKLTSATKIKEQVQSQRIEVPVFDEKQFTDIRGRLNVMDALVNEFKTNVAPQFATIERVAKEVRAGVDGLISRQLSVSKTFAAGGARPGAATPARAPVSPTSVALGPGNSEIGGGMRRMLIAIAQRPGLNRRQLGLRAGMSSSSGTFATYLGKLRASQWIEDSASGFKITSDGVQALGEYQPLPEGKDLLDHWIIDLGNSGAARMLRALAEAYPNPLTRDALGEAAGMSAASGTFATYLGKLRTLELVEGRGDLRASAELFN